MWRLDFEEQWMGLIGQCISTISYSILINEIPTGCIFSSRGIRQGDPLFPIYFFFVQKS